MHSILKIAGFALVLTSLAAMAPPDFGDAGEAEITRSKSVRYQRAELMDEAGARRVFKRLRAAAGKVCSDDIHSRRGRGFHDCRNAALAEAVHRIGSPQLTAVASPPRPTQLAGR